MDTGLIIGWTYTKGELAKQKIDDLLAIITGLIAFSVTFIFIYPALQFNIPFTGKLENFLLIASLLIITAIVYYLLKAVSMTVYFLYQKMKGIQEEEILFTDNKIVSSGKIWILNDDNRKLTMVKFSSAKKEALVFKGTESGKNTTSYSITIPVPAAQLVSAEKIMDYFVAKYSAGAAAASTGTAVNISV